MKEFVGLRAKTYSYLTDDNDGSKRKQKLQKMIIKIAYKHHNLKIK